MSTIKDKILAHARARQPEYAERMEVFEPNLPGLPAGVAHYAINIIGLHDYLPISYIAVDEDLYSSLQPDDFSKLMQRLQLCDSARLTALDVAILYLLIDFPSRERIIVESMPEVPLPEDPPAILIQKLSAIVTPANMDRSAGRVETIFFCFNRRTRWLEQFKITVYPSYHYDGELNEVLDVWQSN